MKRSEKKSREDIKRNGAHDWIRGVSMNSSEKIRRDGTVKRNKVYDWIRRVTMKSNSGKIREKIREIKQMA